MSADEGDALAVVLVVHDSAGALPRTLTALAPQLEDRDELVVVDNASSDDPARVLPPRARLHRLDDNRGFAGGAVEGAHVTSAPLLLFLNPDAVPAPGCLAALRGAARRHPGWGAWQALVTLPGGERANTWGGVTHFLGLGWSGGCGEPLGRMPPGEREISFASGAALVVRREAWERIGGFDPSYFMYGEDLDLSLRLWLAGREVGVVPGARVAHDYDFHKGDYKWFYLERNRARTVLTTYPRGLLALLAPALLALELALLLAAARDGWLGPKLRAQWAVLSGLPQLRRRRRRVQETRAVSDAAFARVLTASVDSPYLGDLPRPLVRAQAAGWALVRRRADDRRG